MMIIIIIILLSTLLLSLPVFACLTTATKAAHQRIASKAKQSEHVSICKRVGQSKQSKGRRQKVEKNKKRRKNTEHIDRARRCERKTVGRLVDRGGGGSGRTSEYVSVLVLVLVVGSFHALLLALSFESIQEFQGI